MILVQLKINRNIYKYITILFVLQKGGGAIFNTVKTKANPAMKTVYKFVSTLVTFEISSMYQLLILIPYVTI